jgi:hypothetical protein
MNGGAMNTGDIFVLMIDNKQTGYCGPCRRIFGPYIVLKPFDRSLREDSEMNDSDFVSYMNKEGFIKYSGAHIWTVTYVDGAKKSETCEGERNLLHVL